MKVYITRIIPEKGINLLKEQGFEVVVNPEDRILSRAELIAALQANRYDAVLCLLTDKIDAEVMDAVGPQCKIFANYAVGFDNIDLAAAAAHTMLVSNTPGVLSNAVAEHTFALMFAVARRVVESDHFIRAGTFEGWAPMMLLGNEVTGKTLGIVGLGAIGSRVGHIAAAGFGMKVIYHDVKRSEAFETDCGGVYHESVDDVFKEADFVSLHVPLVPATEHLANDARLRMMKKTAYLINTARGPVVDEVALVKVLQEGVIAGAGLDVFEHEPQCAPGLTDLSTVVLTPHTASATVETRDAMVELAAKNIIEALAGRMPPTLVAAK
ncbi:D-glycerate dehydrogenase [Candidatus Kaiserbacteria bacterium]|nr:D-glycerate dehydrogenase [Candidatus Kaiserbacteria bacterium]